MTYKKFHIWDFPEDKVRVLLDRNMNFSFWNKCIDKFGSIEAISDYVGTSSTTILDWKRGNRYITLRILKKLVKKSGFTFKEIEQKIISYRGWGDSKPIMHPKLPIEESPELFSIITHFICDGCISSERVPMYINSNENLLENFVDSVREVFGDVPISKRKVKDKTRNYVLPRIISDIMLNFYNIPFDSENSRLPERVFELPDEFGCSVIRSVVDDEGHVRDNSIIIGMKNKKLVFQIRNLVRKILGEDSVGKLGFRKRGLWSFRIRSSYMGDFSEKIKLIHPLKGKDVEYYVRKQKFREIGRGEFLWETKLQILKILKNKDNDVKNLSYKLLINTSNTVVHLNKLSEIGYVRKIRIYGSSPIWGITQKGLNFLKEWGVGHGKKPVVIPNWHKRFEIKNKQCRILLNDYMRKRLFWMLGRTLGNQSKISNRFSVHRNTICFWKNGNTLIPLKSLNQILIFLGDRRINLVDEVCEHITEIKSINGIFTWYRR